MIRELAVHNDTINKKSSGFLNFTVGGLKLAIVTDGHVYFKRIQPVLSQDISEEEIEKVLQAQRVDKVLYENFLPIDKIDAAINVLLVKKNNEIILIDTGLGIFGGEDAGKLIDNLLSAGISAKDITAIVLTHAHIDHLGGILDKEGEYVFPNASIYMSRIEYDFWLSENPDFSRSKRQDNSFSIQLARTTLSKIKTKLQFFNDGDIIFDCMQIISAPGHTPGHINLNLFSEGEELLHIVDTASSAEILFQYPEWGTELDADFPAAIITRKNILENLALNRKKVFANHLPWPGLGHVRKKGEAYEWVPLTFSTPQLYDVNE